MTKDLGRDEGTAAHVVRDRDRELKFRGRLLGSATSKAAGKQRWSEIAIYKTEAGAYIVCGCGRSEMPGESDRPWAQVCEAARGVVERLHMMDDDQSRYLPYVNRAALDEARSNDENLAQAFLVETVE
jgi:hypothetical protein